jgi:hypothetical protein
MSANFPLPWRMLDVSNCTWRRLGNTRYVLREHGLFTSFWSTVVTFNTEVSRAYERSKEHKGRISTAGKEFSVFIEHLLRPDQRHRILESAGNYEILVGHPLYVVLGFVMSKNGFGFDLTKFRTYDAFKRVITARFLSRILLMVIKTGK